MGLTRIPTFKPGVEPMRMLLELRTQDESHAEQSATVTMLMDGRPMLRVRAYIDRGKGADGGWYPVIKFREVESCP